MRKRLTVGILALLLSGASLADDPAISRIRKEYQSIQKALPTLKAESRPLDDYSNEGGEGKAYRDSKGNIRLLKIELMGEGGKIVEELYFENGALIFAFYEHHHYNVPFTITPQVAKEIGSEPFDPKKTKITEDRYYFNNGKMIRWLNESKTEVKPDSEEFKKAEKEVTETSNDMLSNFKEKSNSSVPLTP